MYVQYISILITNVLLERTSFSNPDEVMTSLILITGTKVYMINSKFVLYFMKYCSCNVTKCVYQKFP